MKCGGSAGMPSCCAKGAAAVRIAPSRMALTRRYFIIIPGTYYEQAVEKAY
jgi:hypothetical protein